MRATPERLLIAMMGLFALTGLAAVTFQKIDAPRQWVPPVQVDPIEVPPVEVAPVTTVSPTDAAAWFQAIRQYCNPVEVETRMRWQPAPGTEQGSMHEAACYALAGKIDLARVAIERLPEGRRYEAAGVVFGAGHPAADAGDELAAGPLMELVVEFWPNHYMALYHAGASSYERGEHEASIGYLNRFLEEYHVEDGWRSNATSMLATMGA